MASYAMIKELREKKDKNGNGYLDLIELKILPRLTDRVG